MNILDWFRRKPEPSDSMFGTVVGHIKDGRYLIETPPDMFVEAYEMGCHRVLAGVTIRLVKINGQFYFDYGACR